MLVYALDDGIRDSLDEAIYILDLHPTTPGHRAVQLPSRLHSSVAGMRQIVKRFFLTNAWETMIA